MPTRRASCVKGSLRTGVPKLTCSRVAGVSRGSSAFISGLPLRGSPRTVGVEQRLVELAPLKIAHLREGG